MLFGLGWAMKNNGLPEQPRANTTSIQEGGPSQDFDKWPWLIVIVAVLVISVAGMWVWLAWMAEMAGGR